LKITLRRSTVYIPDWNGNKKLKKEDQIKVHYNYLTTEQRNDFIVSGGKLSVAKVGKEVFLAAVTKIENLTAEIDGEEVEITKENIFDVPDLHDLYMDVTVEIISSSSLDSTSKKK